MAAIETVSISLARAVGSRTTRLAGRSRRRGRMLTTILLFAAAAALLVSPTDTARAQTLFSPTGGKSATDTNRPMLLQADEMIYDNQNNTVTARGNVEIYYGSYTLLAEKVVYDQGAKTLAAEGDVRIKEPNGALINADRITLTDDFRDGFVRSLKIVTREDARIAAARGIREDGDTTVFENAVYTPCKVCEDRPEKPPTWQIKASRVIHKKSEATISYERAKLEFLGVPIAWVPFFRHADPSVKRKSGFLIPQFGQSDQLGYLTETPYYFALAPNYDFTFAPMVTTKRGVVLKGKWRHRTAHGRYQINMAGIYQTDKPSTTLSFLPINFTGNPGDRNFRGTIDSKGEFAINEFWDWGWDATASTDDTFRRFYKIDTILETEQISTVFLRGMGDRSFLEARLYQFGALTFEDTSNAESRVHPVIDYNYVFADPVLGGELSFDANVLSLSANDAADSNRLITEVKWRRQFIDRRGQVITPFFSARGDLYQVSNVVEEQAILDPITNTTETIVEVPRDTNGIARGMAVAGAEYRYPFVRHGSRAAHVVEPIVQLIARPGLRRQEDIPNEDARSLVFDDTLLFDVDKFSGYDRIETGTRGNVGLRYTLQSYEGGYMRAVFGQSYHIAGDNEFAKDTGLETTRSDYVAGLYIQPMKYFTFIGQGRFDEKTFDLRRTDLTATVGYGPISTSTTYANLKAQPSLGILDPRQEILGGASLLLTKHWSLFGGIRYDIERDKRLNDHLGLKWADDCFALSVTYAESFIRDRDIEPNESVMVRFEFKHLGAYNIDAGGLGDQFDSTFGAGS